MAPDVTVTANRERLAQAQGPTLAVSGPSRSALEDDA